MVPDPVSRARSPDALARLETRRLEAAQLFRRGKRPAEVARQLGVSRTAAGNWYHRWQEGGRASLKSKRAPGRPAELTARQKKQLLRAIVGGPQAHGWKTDMWTLERIRTLIRRKFGVRYHVGHIWHVVRQLGLTPQRPQGRARERDEGAVRRWLRWKWPAIKKNSNDAAPGS